MADGCSIYQFGLSLFCMRKFLPFLAVLIFLISCRSPRYIYSPSVANNPYFKEKGDSKVAAYYSGGADDNLAGTKNQGADVQVAYAIGNHWALTASWYQRQERDVYTYPTHNFFTSSTINYKRHLADVGGGLFIPVGNSKTVSFNLYAGLGFGRFSFTDEGIDKASAAYERSHSTKVSKTFLQPSINIMPGRLFRMSFIWRVSNMHYGNISTSYTNDEQEYFTLNRLHLSNLTFFEPALNMQLGIPKAEWIKIDGGFTFCSDPLADGWMLRSRGFTATIGVCIDPFAIKK